ncbi:MAG: hypothetical protein II789_09975, partial [Clostridia bacterium]|nr:hypothetical protein [Clostridia bacterium]
MKKLTPKLIIRLITISLLFPALFTGLLTGKAEAGSAEPEQYGGIDGLGRIITDSGDTARPKKTRYVGMFFWDWH